MKRSEIWRVWDDDSDYGELLYKRATGELPEMESSKAVANIVKGWIKPGDRILDVGCGAGHYYRSLRREIDTSFSYTGVDATQQYIDYAQKAWSGVKETVFQVADVFSLPFQDGEFDIVISCNLFHHLPSIKKPLAEVCRVANRQGLIRMLVGERSFYIKQVEGLGTYLKSNPGVDAEDEFNENGEPRSFGYFNIYSQSYVNFLVSQLPGVKNSHLVEDREFDSQKIMDETQSDHAAPDTSTIVSGWQVNTYILQPWQFILINK